ncbi:MAG TPA: heme-binding protein [Rhodocyclaceae bacterium]|nr:heme-binding protein [Rhodocyclaceae bacterium]
MRRPQFAALLVSLLLAGPAAAEKLVTGFTTLSTDAAEKVARATLAECQRQGYTVAVAVVDRSGIPLVLLRDNLAGPHTPTTAINKAWTATSFRVDTSDLMGMTELGKPAAGIRSLPNVVAVGGGLMIQAKGTLLGAVGVSGAPGGTQDHNCGQAGIQSIQDSLELD